MTHRRSALDARALTVALAMAAAVPTLAAEPPATATTPATRAQDARRDPGEEARLDPSDVEAVYGQVLRFYRPPRNQRRWLDPALLRAAGDTAARRLEPRMAERLVAAAGPSFCLLGGPDPRRGSSGAELRLSPIRAGASGRVLVVVACRLVQFPGVRIDVPGQEFVLERSPRGWRIVDRHGVHAP
jgi:hypothetical protein